MRGRKLHPWKRFWRPEGVEVSCGYSGEGFLDDPEGKRGLRPNPNCRPLAELLDANPLLVLCGPPGSGKTTELETISESRKNSEEVAVIFRRADSFGAGPLLADLTVRSREWLQACDAGKRILFIVDGLDEALQREQTLLSSLVELLKAEPLDRVSLVLSCRSAHWQTGTGMDLARLWGREGGEFVYEICPLRSADVRQTLKEEMPDRIDPFFAEIERIAGVPLARWPITLEMLLEHFVKSDGKLPASRATLYRDAIGRLAEEWDEGRESRQRAFSPDWMAGEKVQLARRIAALMIFGGRRALLRKESSPVPDCLGYLDIFGDSPFEEGPSGSFFSVTREKIDWLAGTRLFEGAVSPDGSSLPPLRFSHRSLAEMLAGEYVAKLGCRKLRQLFFVRQATGEELIVPQLLQTAAWLAGSSDDEAFFDLMLSLHSEAFLIADLSPLDDYRKRIILERLLEKSLAGDSGPDRAVSKASQSLKFPGIEERLRPVILDETANLHARRFALNLARTCRISELADSLWAILDRPDDPMALEAAHTLRQVEEEPESKRDRLLRLASGEANSDSTDTLKGVALELLVPRCLPVREILDLLSPPQMSFYFGSYRRFLNHELPNAVTAQDLEASLDFLREKPDCFDTLSTFDNFANRVFELSYENLGNPAISDRLVRLWLEKSRNFQPLPRESERVGEGVSFRGGADATAFVEAFLNHPKVTCDDISQLVDQISGISLPYLLQRLPSAVPDRRANWALAIRYAAWAEDRVDHRELLQRSYEEYAEVRERFPPIQKAGCDLHDTLCRHERAAEIRLARRKKRNEARMQAYRKRRPTWKEVFRTGVEQCCRGEAGGWINVSFGLRGDSGSEGWSIAGVEGPELFQKLSDAERHSVRDCAKRFLIEFDDARDETGHRTNWSEAGYEAARWLREEIAANPELKTTIREKWIGAIVEAFNNGEEEHQRMVQLAYELDPVETRRCFRRRLDRTLTDEGEGWLSELPAFEAAWDRSFSVTLADFLAVPQIKPRSLTEGLNFLLEHDAEFGAETVSKHLENVRARDPGLQLRASRVVAGVAWFFGGDRLKHAAWPLVAGNTESTKKLLLETVPDLDRGRRNILDGFPSSQIADLLLLVFSLFPPDDDPPFRHEMTFVTATDACVQLRGDLIRNLSKRGETEEIRRFLNSLPAAKADLYRWSLNEAKQNRAMLDWAPSRPEDLLRLVRISTGSLIRNADDLLDAVMESLERFQDDLQMQHLHRVWDGDTPKREEFVSKELATWLTSDLKKIVVNREVEVNRWNERVDIKIEALSGEAQNELPFTLIIEVKRAHNPEIPRSIEEQLVEKYLQSNHGWSHGIYLVAWFYTKGKWEGRRYLRNRTAKGARSELKAHCKAVEKTRGVRIEPFLLDCSFQARR